MKKHMKGLMAAVLVLAMLAFTGCNLNIYGQNLGEIINEFFGGYATTPSGSSSTSYVSSSESFAGEKISKIEVEWVTGSVEVVSGDTVSYEVEEPADLPDKRKTGYELKGDTLVIKEYNETEKFTLNFNLDTLNDYESKTLRLTVPAGLSELELRIVSAEVSLDAVSTDRLEIESVSAQISADDLRARNIKMSTVSGSMDLKLPEGAEEIKVNAVSGNVTLYLPEDIGFTAETDSVSSEFSSDRPTERKNDTVVSGDGAVSIKMNAVSGKLEIYTLK